MRKRDEYPVDIKGENVLPGDVIRIKCNVGMRLLWITQDCETYTDFSHYAGQWTATGSPDLDWWWFAEDIEIVRINKRVNATPAMEQMTFDDVYSFA